ncbi:MAG: OmpA family protein [Rhodobacterales bacterium]|nr:OmpA family protein [Rhodobacterales bacterium]
MRLPSNLIAAAVFMLAGLLSVLGARTAVSVIEERSGAAVVAALHNEGQDWAQVVTDGLQLILEGQAPNEAARFSAMSIAGSIVDAARVIDDMTVVDTAGIAAPDFAIEILRNDSGVSLIGLIPASTDREALNSQIVRIAGGQTVTDLLQTADYAVPANWQPSLDYALRALGQLPRSKISVGEGRVTVTAISDSPTHKRQLEAELARNVPSTVRLGLTITAPRPVVSPFTVRFVKDAQGARFDACAADTEETRDKIVLAATAAGVEGQIDCRLALGVPSLTWGNAVALAIKAVADLGGGTVTFSNADVVLSAAEGTDQATFDRVVGELSNALPELYSLTADLPLPPEATEEGPPEFTGTLSPEGDVQLRGRVPDDLINTTVENLAAARFGKSAVTMGTRITGDGLPPGWSIRVLAGVEALDLLENGSVLVQPDLVTVKGNTGEVDARDAISRLLIARLGQMAKFQIDVTYLEELDPLAALPSPEECVAQIGMVTASRKITFEPGSATLSADTMPVVDDIAEILRKCSELKIRIAGYTDSQGRDEMNQELSQDRAEAVLDALRSRRVPVGGFEAMGFGEADPIADNETEEGREANRRIEFSLILPEGPVEEPTTLEGLEGRVAPSPEGDGSAVGEAPADGSDVPPVVPVDESDAESGVDAGSGD